MGVEFFFSKSNYMCKFLICHVMLHSECLLLLNINFVNSGKECKKAIIFLMNLVSYILIYMTKLKKKILINTMKT